MVYNISIDPTDEGGFAARVLNLPGCMSDGETEAEALQNVLDAMQSWLAQNEAMGR